MNWHDRMYKNFFPAMKHLIGAKCTYLEIGVFQGATARWVLDTILTHPESRLIGIDPWDRNLYTRREIPDDKTWDDIMAGIDNLCNNPKVRMLKGYSQNVINARYGFKNDSIDAVYIDGEHSFAAVVNDFKLSWPLLKIGGVIIFDDYDSKATGSPQVKIAIDGILNALKTDCRVLFKNRQVGIVREA